MVLIVEVLVSHFRVVNGTQHACKSDVAIGSQTFHKIALPFTVKRVLELLRLSSTSRKCTKWIFSCLPKWLTLGRSSVIREELPWQSPIPFIGLGTICNGHCLLEEEFRVFALFFFRDDAVFGKGFIAKRFEIETSCSRTGSRGNITGGSPHTKDGHPVTASDRNIECTETSEELADQLRSLHRGPVGPI